jgi:hypothetical protein
MPLFGNIFDDKQIPPSFQGADDGGSERRQA